MKAKTLVQLLAEAYAARNSCWRLFGSAGFNRWEDRIERAERLLPSGGGFDSGTTCDGLQSVVGAERLVFRTSYHHMAATGHYTGWSEWLITVTPDWSGVTVRVWLQSETCEEHDLEGTEEYIGDTFAHVLAITVDAEGNRCES